MLGSDFSLKTLQEVQAAGEAGQYTPCQQLTGTAHAVDALQR